MQARRQHGVQNESKSWRSCSVNNEWIGSRRLQRAAPSADTEASASVKTCLLLFQLPIVNFAHCTYVAWMYTTALTTQAASRGASLASELCGVIADPGVQTEVHWALRRSTRMCVSEAASQTVVFAVHNTYIPGITGRLRGPRSQLCSENNMSLTPPIVGAWGTLNLAPQWSSDLSVLAPT